MIYQHHITLSTQTHGDMHDITDQVNSIVRKSGIKTGMAHVFNVGSTASIGTIEFEPGLQGDLPELLKVISA
ncbi:YjbQ family protein [Gloeocapsopsis sp. IPPAS B-1203]|uniref:YjbQ family protein n=1 Tax=Gloeocapsopsis sp. IPPAS B-1203 TaxID=2049454 RepID=UPI0025A0C9B2|nr:YjbQ family protein [Gloeocapsopsis sp. IPPAS B-1203]